MTQNRCKCQKIQYKYTMNHIGSQFESKLTITIKRIWIMNPVEVRKRHQMGEDDQKLMPMI